MLLTLMATKKDMQYNKIGLHAQKINTILGLILNKLGHPSVITYQRKKEKK